MSKSDRNNPKRAKNSESRYTFMDFERDFPDDATCLEWLVGHLYPDGIFCPKCERVTKHHRVRARTCYECQFCGHQEYPLVGTIFEGSATSLRLWFHAMFLMAQTRCGISAKQIEREVGVTYKTAWRMANRIRTLLQDQSDELLSGEVEVDETAYGGKPRASDHIRGPQQAAKWVAENKTSVFGMVERGGRVRAMVVPDRKAGTLGPRMATHILPEAIVFSDEYRSYVEPGKRFAGHHRIHHKAGIYVDGNVHTQTIEGFFGLVKTGIQGVYHAVGRHYLQSYLDEYAFRYNHRTTPEGMFGAFLSRIEKV